MDFRHSTQARSWTFNTQTLAACRQKALQVHDGSNDSLSCRARKFASGFHRRFRSSEAVRSKDDSARSVEEPFTALSVSDQESVLRFHAQQIQSLVGPTAILPELRKSETVLSTAVTFFRRFFLSNSVTEIHPRTIAVASAFLASKVEEERVEVSISWWYSLTRFQVVSYVGAC